MRGNERNEEELKIPINENCADERIPRNAELPDGRKAILVPVAKTMTDYIWSHYTLAMFRYLGRLLRTGELERITGIRVLNKVFNGQSFRRSKKINYWKINRESFYADIPVTLELATNYGARYWKGYLCFWCWFDEECLQYEITELTQNPEREGYEILTKYLVPLLTNREVDYLTQEMWQDYGIPEALKDPKARNPFLLAHRMRFKIFYCRFRRCSKISSIFFFREGDMEVESNVWQVDENGKKTLYKKFDRTPFRVPEDSIIVNESFIRFKYVNMKIYHECIHGRWHYLYYRLQDLANNDPTNLETKLIAAEEYRKCDDPLYFMEKQAKRGQFGLDMPRDAVLRLIEEGEDRVTSFKNGGDRYEQIGADIMRTYGEPDFFARTRMIQLGKVQAYGSYNRADRQRIAPYGFSQGAFFEDGNRMDDDEVITYKIEKHELDRICKENEDFRKLMESGDYVYVPGHVVVNDRRYVEYKNGRWELTDFALEAIDRCCMRFVQVFVQEYPGHFRFDRMYSDTEFYKQTKLYLDAFLEEIEKHPEMHHDVDRDSVRDEFDARELYGKEYPVDFYDGIKQIIRYNGSSLFRMAEDFNMNEDTLKRWLQSPKNYRDADFLMEICLYFKLPDWHSRLVFKRARVVLDEDIRRDKILMDILRGRSCDGIDSANEYLVKHGELKLGAVG